MPSTNCAPDAGTRTALLSYPSCPLCPLCPLCPQRLPDDLDAQAVAQLLDLLYAIADHLQQRYHHQLLRYYAELRDPPQSPPPPPTDLPAGHDDLPF